MAASHPCYIHSFCRLALEVDQPIGIELFTSREDPVRWLCTVVALWQNKAKISTGEGWCAEAWKNSTMQKLSQFWATVVIMSHCNLLYCLGTSQTALLQSISAALLCSNSSSFPFDWENAKKSLQNRTRTQLFLSQAILPLSLVWARYTFFGWDC